jgi:micrococcal nuclease
MADNKKLVIATALGAALGVGVDMMPRDNIVLNRVIDGDTIAVNIKRLPTKFTEDIRIRINGVDTPESLKRFAECDKELELGLKAKEYTKAMVANANTLSFELHKYGKYANRILGDVIIDGKPLSKLLIDEGYAKPYFGKTKISWCD